MSWKVSALRDEALEAIARETGEAAESERVHTFPPCGEKAQQWRDKNTDPHRDTIQEKEGRREHYKRIWKRSGELENFKSAPTILMRVRA